MRSREKKKSKCFDGTPGGQQRNDMEFQEEIARFFTTKKKNEKNMEDSKGLKK